MPPLGHIPFVSTNGACSPPPPSPPCSFFFFFSSFALLPPLLRLTVLLLLLLLLHLLDLLLFFSSSTDPTRQSLLEVKGDASNESPGKSAFTIPEPVREDQVQNAVKFLSHPNVRSSPVIHRRVFLEKKGLTKEEIDEAFRRVPDSLINGATNEATITAIPSKSSTTMQPQVPSQITKRASTFASLTSISRQYRFHWSQALFVIGIITASGAGTAILFKKKIVPKLKAWIRSAVEEENDFKLIKRSKTNVVEEAAEAAKAAASAAAAVAVTSQELLNAQREEKKYFEAFTRVLDVQLEEMKSLSNAIHQVETTKTEFAGDKGINEHLQSDLWKGTTNNAWRTIKTNQSSSSFSSGSKHTKENGFVNMGSGTVKPSSDLSMEPQKPPPHPKSYMEIIELLQRGEKPPNIKDIDDNPPNPHQPITKPLIAPRPKPWEVSLQDQQRSTYVIHSQPNRRRLNSEVRDNNSVLNGSDYGGSGPWWRKKIVKISEVESDSEEQFYDAVRTHGSPMKRGWTPPESTAFLIPEAADASRKPNSFLQVQRSRDDNYVVTSSKERLDLKGSDAAFKHQRSYSLNMDLNRVKDRQKGFGTEIY